MFVQFGEIQIPCGMVTAFSYTLKARLIENRDGAVYSTGYEAPECSIRIFVSPSICTLFGLDFPTILSSLLDLDISRKATPTFIKIGDFVPCRSCLFAPTSIHVSTTADAESYEFDITLSPVQNALLSTSNRASAVAGDTSNLPKVVLACNGASLELKDEISFTELLEMPDGCTITALIGDDSRLSEFETWAGNLTKGGKITLTTSEEREYYVTTAALLDGELNITGSIYPPAAFESATKTYRNIALSDILSDIANMFGFKAKTNVTGTIDYFLLEGKPIDALRELSNSAGFMISATAGTIAFVDVPETVNGVALLQALPVEDVQAEKVTTCVWRDGQHEYHVTDGGDGNTIEVDSVFLANSDTYARKRLTLENYNNRSFKVNLPLDLRVILHSPVSVQTRGGMRTGLVEYYYKDYIAGGMELHVNTLGDI